MPQEHPVDEVDWMRVRWSEHQLPNPAQFAAMASILRTNAILTDRISRVTREFGLSRTAYLVLITLKMSREGTRSLGQLSKALLVHPTTITMIVDQLEKVTLVRREAHPTDRRTVLAKLTPGGRTVADSATAALAATGFGLGTLPAGVADRLTSDLRCVREVGVEDQS